ncbi:hypothetical protein ACH4VM_39730 [Streptomyces sp. NPDC020792]|uniref:hypothetical protein n=1 Tax=Streptomyces sp. NPDC020792 TaxID=3365089 RepID=UPI00378DA2FE
MQFPDRTPLEAKFSLAFTAALALVKGRCQVADFSAEQVRDALLLSVAERVRVRFVADLPRSRRRSGSIWPMARPDGQSATRRRPQHGRSGA